MNFKSIYFLLLFIFTYSILGQKASANTLKSELISALTTLQSHVDRLDSRITVYALPSGDNITQKNLQILKEIQFELQRKSKILSPFIQWIKDAPIDNQKNLGLDKKNELTKNIEEFKKTYIKIETSFNDQVMKDPYFRTVTGRLLRGSIDSAAKKNMSDFETEISALESIRDEFSDHSESSVSSHSSIESLSASSPGSISSSVISECVSGKEFNKISTSKKELKIPKTIDISLLIKVSKKIINKLTMQSSTRESKIKERLIDLERTLSVDHPVGAVLDYITFLREEEFKSRIKIETEQNKMKTELALRDSMRVVVEKVYENPSVQLQKALLDYQEKAAVRLVQERESKELFRYVEFKELSEELFDDFNLQLVLLCFKNWSKINLMYGGLLFSVDSGDQDEKSSSHYVNDHRRNSVGLDPEDGQRGVGSAVGK